MPHYVLFKECPSFMLFYILWQIALWPISYVAEKSLWQRSQTRVPVTQTNQNRISQRKSFNFPRSVNPGTTGGGGHSPDAASLSREKAKGSPVFKHNFGQCLRVLLGSCLSGGFCSVSGVKEGFLLIALFTFPANRGSRGLPEDCERSGRSFVNLMM